MGELPPDEIMRAMSKLAVESAAEYFARMADTFAATLDDAIGGRDALLAFARAIRSTNARIYPNEGRPS